MQCTAVFSSISSVLSPESVVHSVYSSADIDFATTKNFGILVLRKVFQMPIHMDDWK